MSAAEELRRGWLVLVAAFLGIGFGVSSITLYTGGLFVDPLERATGWARGWVAGGSTVTTLGIALSSPVAGWLLDRFGSRRTAAVSLLSLSAGYLALGALPLALPGYLATLFIMGVVSSGSSPITFTRAVNGCFAQLRGLALGVSLAGAGAVGSVAPLVLGPVIAGRGWRSGYFALAAAVAAIIPITFFGLRAAGDAAVKRARCPAAGDFRKVIRSPTLWCLALSFALAAGAMAGVVFHFVPILQSQGIGRADAVRAASVLGASVMVGRLFTGIALDRLFGPWVGAAVLVFAAGGCAMLSGSGGSFRAAGVLVSFAMGTEVDLVAYLVARYFGLQAYGRVYGVIFALVLVGAGLGPWLFGWAYDRTKTYEVVLQGAAALCLVAAVMMLLLPRYPGEGRLSRATDDGVTGGGSCGRCA